MKTHFAETDPISDYEAATFFRGTFGDSFVVASVKRLHDGCVKYTYVVKTDQPEGKYILQVGKDPLSALTSLNTEEMDRFWGTGSFQQLATNIEHLRAHGISVPAIVRQDCSKQLCEFDLILMEHVGTHSLEEEAEPLKVDLVSRMGELYGRLHGLTHSVPGWVGQKSTDASDCMALVEAFTKQAVELAAEYDPATCENRTRIADALASLRAKCQPRHEFSLVHGDLQRSHIRIGPGDRITLIDLDAVKFFDREWDVCLFDMPPMSVGTGGFYESYRKHVAAPVDPNRIQFYRISHFVQWISFFAEAVVKKEGDYERFEFYLDSVRSRLLEELKI